MRIAGIERLVGVKNKAKEGRNWEDWTIYEVRAVEQAIEQAIEQDDLRTTSR